MYRPIRLYEGDKLKDLWNVYEVVGSKSTNTHSQYASHYFIKCLSGPNVGRETWITNDGLVEYLPGGRYHEAHKKGKTK